MGASGLPSDSLGVLPSPGALPEPSGSPMTASSPLSISGPPPAAARYAAAESAHAAFTAASPATPDSIAGAADLAAEATLFKWSDASCNARRVDSNTLRAASAAAPFIASSGITRPLALSFSSVAYFAVHSCASVFVSIPPGYFFVPAAEEIVSAYVVTFNPFSRRY